MLSQSTAGISFKVIILVGLHSSRNIEYQWTFPRVIPSIDFTNSKFFTSFNICVGAKPWVCHIAYSCCDVEIGLNTEICIFVCLNIFESLFFLLQSCAYWLEVPPLLVNCLCFLSRDLLNLRIVNCCHKEWWSEENAEVFLRLSLLMKLLAIMRFSKTPNKKV